MARIIDKEEKRSLIAIASIDLFYQKGIQQTSIDEIAKSAGVAKGTIYLYFKNKEEIMFAIWDIIAQQHEEAYAQRITQNMSTKEKILEFFNFSACHQDAEHEKILHLYQHFVSSMLIDTTGLYTSYFDSFFQKDYDVVSKCLQEGIDSGEINQNDIVLMTNTIILFTKGILTKAKASNFDFNTAQAFLTKHLSFLIDTFSRKPL